MEKEKIKEKKSPRGDVFGGGGGSTTRETLLATREGGGWVSEGWTGCLNTNNDTKGEEEKKKNKVSDDKFLEISAVSLLYFWFCLQRLYGARPRRLSGACLVVPRTDLCPAIPVRRLMESLT